MATRQNGTIGRTEEALGGAIKSGVGGGLAGAVPGTLVGLVYGAVAGVMDIPVMLAFAAIGAVADSLLGFSGSAGTIPFLGYETAGNITSGALIGAGVSVGVHSLMGGLTGAGIGGGIGAGLFGAKGALAGVREANDEDQRFEMKRQNSLAAKQELAADARGEGLEKGVTMGYMQASQELAPYYFQKGQESVVQQIIAAKQAEQAAQGGFAAQVGKKGETFVKAEEKRDAMATVVGPQAV